METVVVTGGSAGIGKAICQQSLARGHRVISLDLNPPGQGGAQVIHHRVDLTDAVAVKAVAAKISAEYPVTRLVNNAGVSRLATAAELSESDLDDAVALHLKAPLFLLQAFLPAMLAAQFGRVVNIATRAVLGRAQRSAYSATKAGMIGYTRTWALELGKRGITVNTIAPGPVATDLFERNNPRGSAEREKIMSMLAVPEIGTPDDVASAVSFFLSDASRYITGQTLFVCGGSSIGAAPI